MSSNDPVLDTLLDEVITGRTPPDLSARIASRAQGVEVAEDEMSRSQAMAQVIKLHEHRADRWLRTGLVAAAAFIIGVGVFAWSPWSEDDDGIPISNTNLPYVADLGPGIIPGRAASFSKRNDMPQLDSGYALVKKGAKPIYAGGRKVSPRSGDALVWVGGQPQARDIGEMQDWVHANNNVNLSYDGLARLASPEGWNRQGDVSVCVLDGEVDYGPAKYTVIEKPLFRDADAMFQSLFTGLDRDGDGAINTNESALKSFAGLDRNGDGVLDLNEYSSNWTRVLKGNLGESGAFEFKYSTHATMNGRPMDGTVYEQSGEGDAAFDVLDKDGDGVLTADEAPWVDTMFKTYDKNCDGMVSRDEYAIVPGAKSAFRSSFHNEKRESSNSSSSSSDSSSSGSSSSGDMDQRVKEMMDEMKKRVDEEMGKAKQDGGTDAAKSSSSSSHSSSSSSNSSSGDSQGPARELADEMRQRMDKEMKEKTNEMKKRMEEEMEKAKQNGGAGSSSSSSSGESTGDSSGNKKSTSQKSSSKSHKEFKSKDRREIFDHYDADGDGLISRQEWPFDKGFEELDTNGDGFLTFEEKYPPLDIGK